MIPKLQISTDVPYGIRCRISGATYLQSNLNRVNTVYKESSWSGKRCNTYDGVPQPVKRPLVLHSSLLANPKSAILIAAPFSLLVNNMFSGCEELVKFQAI